MLQKNRVIVLAILSISTMCQLSAIEVPGCIRTAATWLNNNPTVKFVAGMSIAGLGLATAKINGWPVRPMVTKGLFLGGALSLVNSKWHAAAVLGASALFGITARFLGSPQWQTAAYWGAFSGLLCYHLFDKGRSELISMQMKSILKNNPNFVQSREAFGAHIAQNKPYITEIKYEGACLRKNWWVKYKASVQRSTAQQDEIFSEKVTSSEGNISSYQDHRKPADQPNNGLVIEEIPGSGGEQQPTVPVGEEDPSYEGDDW